MHVFYIVLAAVFVLYLYIVLWAIWLQETKKFIYLLTYLLTDLLEAGSLIQAITWASAHRGRLG